MSRIDGHKLGFWSLRLDAAYCLVLGLLVALAASQIAAVVDLPRPLLFTTGVAVAAWAGLVHWMTSHLRIRLALRLVMGVNILATILIAAAALTGTSLIVIIAVLTLALEVAVFALSQAIAIRHLPPVPAALPAT